MIRRLFIANRGEVASRIARTCRALGIVPLGACAEDEEAAPWVGELDGVVRLAGARPEETYLDADAMVRAALALGADAVHPGYGFLSERASFARAVEAAGLCWVGPPAAAIEAMGDKLTAKALVAQAGVPVLPTWLVGDPRVRFPVLIKAAAGGGGRGMRLVEDPTQLAEAAASARREAEAAFGDDTVFLERWVHPARHVEIQIIGDRFGNLVHLFERECSLQRRHQKILEEAPSPALDDELRASMAQAAIQAARAIGYASLGTVEFVLDTEGGFWFLEMNTRLQVEHPVTEAICGVDLVREQIALAEGRHLSFSQADLARCGHAIEVRIYAEDPAQDFLPQAGTLVDWWVPIEPGVRVDAGVAAGARIGTAFDPLLAKVVAHAATREDAARLLAGVLRRARIRGVRTNRELLVAVLEHARFLAGDTTTDFLATTALARSTTPDPSLLAEAGAVAALWERDEERARLNPPLAALPLGWTNAILPPRRRSYLAGETTVELEYQPAGDGEILVGKQRYRLVLREGNEVAYAREDPDEGVIIRRAHVLSEGDRCWVGLPGADVELRLLPRLPAPLNDERPTGGLEAPMPARVIEVRVEADSQVSPGDVLVVLEAMKMEHRIVAPSRSRVIEVRVAVGDQVDRGSLLVVLEELP